MLEGKNIVVTGALQGIGRETVAKFAENGANVIACAYEKSVEFENYIRELSEKNNVDIIPVYFDMKDNESVKAGAKFIAGLKIDIHGLVNVAGISKDALFNMIRYDDLLQTFQVNFFSQIIFTQYIVKIMQRRKDKETECSIAFVSSLAAIYGSEGQVAYSASKAAIIGAVKSMAIELGKNKIRVNTIAPGVIKTTMTDKLNEEILANRIKCMDIPRLGEAEEVADLLMFLMSDLSKHINGQVIKIDGGM